MNYNSGIRNYRSVFLPEVAHEQGFLTFGGNKSLGWDKLSTLKALLRKAGFNGSVRLDVLEALELTRFESSKASVDYHEWIQRCNQL